jgi:GNAT superfamily N-acetyltransferase
MTFVMHTAAERPDLWERGLESASVWPEYNLHGDVLNEWWGFLDAELPDFQFVLHDPEHDLVVAEGHTGPLWWDGDDAALPEGIDQAIEQVFARARSGEPVNTLCALAAETPRDGRRRGLAQQLLAAMRTIAARQGLTRLVAPVRPAWKERYPLTPIDRYVQWRREDGQLLDPWMRIHERLGARVSRPLPRSLRITGSVEEWESWTGMRFPDTGDYVFPEGLTTVHIDHELDRGSYWEPNVWMVHPELDGTAASG